VPAIAAVGLILAGVSPIGIVQQIRPVKRHCVQDIGDIALEQ
jgi:hypothetical protein